MVVFLIPCVLNRRQPVSTYRCTDELQFDVPGIQLMTIGSATRKWMHTSTHVILQKTRGHVHSILNHRSFTKIVWTCPLSVVTTVCLYRQQSHRDNLCSFQALIPHHSYSPMSAPRGPGYAYIHLHGFRGHNYITCWRVVNLYIRYTQSW